MKYIGLNLSRIKVLCNWAQYTTTVSAVKHYLWSDHLCIKTILCKFLIPHVAFYNLNVKIVSKKISQMEGEVTLVTLIKPQGYQELCPFLKF